LTNGFARSIHLTACLGVLAVYGLIVWLLGLWGLLVIGLPLWLFAGATGGYAMVAHPAHHYALAVHGWGWRRYFEDTCWGFATLLIWLHDVLSDRVRLHAYGLR
jgi:hypothetical protein